MKLWSAIAAALVLAGASTSHAQTTGQSDDYVCNHGDPSEGRTRDACARLRGTASTSDEGDAGGAPIRERRHAPPPPPAPSASKLSASGQSLGDDTGAVAPTPPAAQAPTLAQGPKAASSKTEEAAAAPPVPPPAPAASATSAPPGPPKGLSVLTIGGIVSIIAGTVLAIISAVMFIAEGANKSRRVGNA